MSSAPTRGAVDQIQSGWVGKPAVARTIRIVLFFAPMIVGWLAVRSTKENYWQPPGNVGVVIWIVQAVVVAGLSSFLAVHVARRLVPLSAIFHMTLIFPDQAPSRLGVALRGGTIKKLTVSTDLSGKSDQAAAEQAIALITQLGKHERLTRGHTERVRARAELIGAEMGLDDDELQKLRWGVLLHDIGKLKVPANILDKDSKLTSDEWAIMSQHPAEGALIVEPLRAWLGDWVDAAGQHHERWDGGGYPNGLSGTEISLAGRITAVADAYDVITSKRSYKEALPAEAARQELVRCAGNQFDPAVVRAALQAGLREPRRVGLVGWLLELPVVARFAAAIPAAITAATVAAAATATIVVAGSFGEVVEKSNVPVAIALAEPDSAVRLDIANRNPLGDSALNSPTQGIEVLADDASEANGDGTSTSTTPDAAAPTSTAMPSTTQPGTPATVPGQGTSSPGGGGASATTTPRQSTTTSTTAAPATTSAPATAAPATTSAPTPTTAAPTTTTTTVVTAAQPDGTGIVVLAGPNVPDDLSNNTLESNTLTYVIEEDQLVTLTTDLRVVTFTQGQETVAARAPTTMLPAGTLVCSWLVRFEPVAGQDNRFTVAPTIDFGSPILGLALEENNLADTNILAIDGVDYVDGGVGSSDSFTVTGSTLSLNMRTGLNGLDQLRVITAC